MENFNIKTFQKGNSFQKFLNIHKLDLARVREKILDIYQTNQKKLIPIISKSYNQILTQAIEDIKNYKDKNVSFKIKDNILMEVNSYSDDLDLLKYLIHRYRYDVYPQKKILDYFPPLIQIEPSSICNFRCVFCFETDKSFTDKKNGFMGTMDLSIFKKIIDDIEGKVEFVTLASRGEPLVSKNFSNMLQYCKGKFLNLKINTNASLLDETKIHSILSNDVKTIVFSADAANKDLYEKLRVNGDLEKTLSNIKKFNEIRKKYYSDKKIITRVSGVKFSSDQNFEDMLKLWGDLVDQVAFVDYNPWENTYLQPTNSISEPCSDLWRRMFVWWDGKINPCDVDYKSELLIGNIKESTIEKLWNSQKYNQLRFSHLNKERSKVTPCKGCTVI